jgi:hypothetical protein
MTHIPHMNEARLGPLYIIIQVDTSIFSDPRSPRTRDGHPNAAVASRKSASTVWAVLHVDTFIPVICNGGVSGMLIRLEH